MQNVRSFKLFVVLAAFFFALTAVAPLAMADEVTVTGQIQVNGDTVTLQADDGAYVLQGGDAAQFADQKVQVTGDLAESDGQKVIQVKEVKPAE